MLKADIFFPSYLQVSVLRNFDDVINIGLTSNQAGSMCPKCQRTSRNVHSRYSRELMDLPIMDKKVALTLLVRKFYCKNKLCERKIFTERFACLIKSYGRRTIRLDENLIALGFSASAEVETKISQRLKCEISADTFLRLIRKTELPKLEDIEYVGIDDWSYKKGKKYGSLICDLKSKKPIAVLEGRNSEDIEEWLENHPNIKVVSRDRSGAYAKAFKNKCPEAIQVADRFHLVKNLLDHTKEYMKRKFASKVEIGYEKVVTKKVKKKEKSKPKATSESQKRKINLVKKIKKLKSDGMSIERIHKTTGLARETIRRYIKLNPDIAAKYNLSKSKMSKFTPYQDEIVEYLRRGETPSNISRIIKNKGLKHADTGIRYFIRKLQNTLGISKNNKFSENKNLKIKAPPKKSIWISRFDMTLCLWRYKEKLDKEQINYLEKILKKYSLDVLYSLIQDFRKLIRERSSSSLEIWVEEAIKSNIEEFKTFANGLKNDWTEVVNALNYSYSNGLLEGQVNRLKAIKRQVYGRANFDLLAKKVLYCG